ncbi:hypothetical protein VNO77_33993 [Canavalia gladiata]|uniref:Uncharacterized protein n=1 Tax=Canavalia gladiata TaxID=3824 RepID=A0AAN9KFH5_CANGL
MHAARHSNWRMTTDLQPKRLAQWLASCQVNPGPKRRGIGCITQFSFLLPPSTRSHARSIALCKRDFWELILWSIHALDLQPKRLAQWLASCQVTPGPKRRGIGCITQFSFLLPSSTRSHARSIAQCKRDFWELIWWSIHALDLQPKRLAQGLASCHVTPGPKRRGIGCITQFSFLLPPSTRSHARSIAQCKHDFWELILWSIHASVNDEFSPYDHACSAPL